MNKKSVLTVNKGSAQLVLFFARAYPWRTALMLACLLLAGFFEGARIATILPLITLASDSGAGTNHFLSRIVADFLQYLGFSPNLVVLLSMIVGAMMLKAALTLLAMMQVGYTVAHVATHLRLELVRALLGARWVHFADQPVGSFANAVSTEATLASRAYWAVGMMLAVTLQLMVYVVVTFLMSWRVALAAIGCGVVIMSIFGRLVRIARQSGEKQVTLMNSLLARFTDGLFGIKPLKAMGLEERLGPLLETETKEINKAQQREVISREALSALLEPTLVIFLAFGMYFLLTLGRLDLSSLMILAFLFHRLVTRFGHIQQAYQSMAVYESAFWSLQRKIDEANGKRETLTGVRPPKFERQISLERISYSYDSKLVLANLSLILPVNTLTAITGSSGVGKTTLIDLVTGLLRPDVGEIYIDGIALGEINMKAWRGMIGYVPQETFLLHDTVFHNIALGDSALTENDVGDALQAAGAWDFVGDLSEGMHTVVGERGTMLSGGQRQRIAIARALVRKPRLLILDEATTALDPQTEAAICHTVRALAENVTVVAISHQTAIVDIADAVYVIENGQARARPEISIRKFAVEPKGKPPTILS
jgi:ATP-binding cassette subfamily C protein